jgi:hypothetical protein
VKLLVVMVLRLLQVEQQPEKEWVMSTTTVGGGTYWMVQNQRRNQRHWKVETSPSKGDGGVDTPCFGLVSCLIIFVILRFGSSLLNQKDYC